MILVSDKGELVVKITEYSIPLNTPKPAHFTYFPLCRDTLHFQHKSLCKELKMKRLSTASDIEHNALKEESVLLRIHQLQNGLVQLTDATTAYRLVTKYGDDIRYIAPWKKWVVWNDVYWEVDSSGALIHTRGLEIVRNIYGEIAKTADYRERIEIEKYAIKSESTRQRENFVMAARYIPELNAIVDDLDRDPWLLNVENGTINLRTGELLPHRQEDKITKIAHVQYDRNADCPKWKQFIREIMDYKADLITFLQTAAGWAVSGDISEQSMFIFYGTGAMVQKRTAEARYWQDLAVQG